ncbi:MAG: hypothetical protein FWD71_01655 [Oscillospiraceae bacterium]|nr:hypothetical protein [Oscillospiraceae bacterium]
MAYNIDALKGELVGLHDSIRILREIYNKEEKLINLAIPHIIVVAFACEVAMKGIYFFETTIDLKNSHNLKELFDKLSQATQNEIRNNIANKDFDMLLEKNKNVFNEWRYLYEKTQIDKINADILFLDNFLNVLHEKLNKIS